MEGHAKKCVEPFCDLTNKSLEQVYEVSTPCLDDHPFKKEELETVEELSKVCSQIVMKCLYLGTHWQSRHPVVGKQTGVHAQYE